MPKVARGLSRRWFGVGLAAVLLAGDAVAGVNEAAGACASADAETDVDPSLVSQSQEDINDNRKGRLYALSPQGEFRWAFQPAEAQSAGGKTYGLASRASVGPSGTLYVGTFEDHVYALRPDGEVKWAFAVGDWVDNAPAIGPSGTVYVGSFDGCLYALTAAGNLQWAVDLARPVVASPVIGPSGTIYVTSMKINPQHPQSYLHAIQPNGKHKWQLTKEGRRIRQPEVGPDGTVYFSAQGRESRVHAITPQGDPKWTFEEEAELLAVAPSGTVYVDVTLNDLHALTAAGEISWKFRPDRVRVTEWLVRSVAATSRRTYVGASHERDDQLHALTPEGELKWSVKTPKVGPGGHRSIAIGPSGTLYLGGHQSDKGAPYLSAISPKGDLKWDFGKSRFGMLGLPAVSPSGGVYVSAVPLLGRRK